MKYDDLEDELEYARYNYWSMTFVCSVLLAFAIDEFLLFKFDSIMLLYMCTLFFIGYFTLRLSDWVERVKINISNRHKR